MKYTRKTAWAFVLLYLAFIAVGLYRTSLYSDFLKGWAGLGPFIHWVYGLAGLFFFYLIYIRFRIREVEAHGLIAGLVILFFGALSRIGVTTDRLHFLEHGFFYVLVYQALRFRQKGIVLAGRTFLLCFLFTGVDEGIQIYLPRRNAQWSDVWTNIFSYYLAAGITAILETYKGGGREHSHPFGKRDNLLLVSSVVGIIFWLQYAPKIPHDYTLLYLSGLPILLIPICYLLHLKRAVYQWSWEAIFYLLFLTLVGVASFSHSILGANPHEIFQK